MNKITSIHILLFCLVVLVCSFMFFTISKTTLIQTEKSYYETKKLSMEFRNAKESFIKSNDIVPLIEKFARQTSINNIQIDKLNKKVSIKIEKITEKKIEKFLNKVLNAKLIITKLVLVGSSIEIEVETK